MDEGNIPPFDLLDDDALFSEFINYPELEDDRLEPGLLDTSIPIDLSNVSDTVLQPNGTVGGCPSAPALDLSCESHTSTTEITSLSQGLPHDTTHMASLPSHAPQAQQRGKRPKNETKKPYSRLPGLHCWSLSGGQVPARQPRSCFSDKRRKEVKDIRDIGACLRCQFLKRPCSGGDPCERCVLAADTAAKSKSLTWMECIRPSFEVVDVFEIPNSGHEKAVAKAVSGIFFGVEVPSNVLPFDMTIESCFSALTHFLLNNSEPPSFSITGLLCNVDFSDIIGCAICPSLGKLSKALAHLSVHLYAGRSYLGYRDYTAADLRLGREQVGREFLREIETRVKPSILQSAQKVELQALFLILLSAIVAFRYRAREVYTLPNPGERTFSETKAEALERLLCHYLVKIGRSFSSLATTKEAKYLLDKRTVLWDIPAMSHWEFLHPEDYEDEDFTTDIFSNPHVTDDDIDGAAGTECIFCYRRRDDIIIRHDGIKACVDCLEYLKTSSRDRWKLSKRTLSPRQSRMGLKPVTRGETANDEWNLLIQNRPPPPEISDLFASAPLSAIFQSLRTREIRTFEPAFYRFPSTDDNYENRRRQLAEVKIPLRYRRSLI